MSVFLNLNINVIIQAGLFMNTHTHTNFYGTNRRIINQSVKNDIMRREKKKKARTLNYLGNEIFEKSRKLIILFFFFRFLFSQGRPVMTLIKIFHIVFL